MSQICKVTTVLSMRSSLLEKSAPMVGLLYPVILPLRYCWRSVVLPTPESPRITIFKKFFLRYAIFLNL